MKKTILLSVAILFATVFNYSFGRNAGDEPNQITNLVINANVTVVLVNNSKAALEMVGNNSLTRFITLTKTGETLVIGSTRNRNLREAGTIYVPAHLLRHIRVNSEAHVRSLYALQAPKLDVVINGACNIAISNIGELHFSGTDSYTFEEVTQIHRFPAKALLKD